MFWNKIVICWLWQYGGMEIFKKPAVFCFLIFYNAMSFFYFGYDRMSLKFIFFFCIILYFYLILDKKSEIKMYQCKNLGCNQELKFTMQLARHKSKCSKSEVDKKYFTVELGFQCGKCKKAFSHQSNAVGMSRIIKLRSHKQDTSIRNVIKFLDLVANLRDICSPILTQKIRNAIVVGNLDVQIIL